MAHHAMWEVRRRAKVEGAAELPNLAFSTSLMGNEELSSRFVEHMHLAMLCNLSARHWLLPQQHPSKVLFEMLRWIYAQPMHKF